MTGRKPLEFIARNCKRCGRLCPYEDFKITKAIYTRGFSLSTKCHRCRKAQMREDKRKAYYGDPEYRERTIKSSALWVRTAPPEKLKPRNDYISKNSWVRNNAKVRLPQLPDKLVVFAVQKPQYIGPPSAQDRWWTRYSWMVRIDKPGLQPPQFGVPLLRIDGLIASRHASCPEAWGWVHPIFQRWIERNHGGTMNHGQTD